MMKFIKYTAFPVLCGIVIGMLIASVTKGVNGLSWLAFGLDFGMVSPLILDLGIFDLTFGLSVDINVATIICITLCLIVAKFIYRR